MGVSTVAALAGGGTVAALAGGVEGACRGARGVFCNVPGVELLFEVPSILMSGADQQGERT